MYEDPVWEEESRIYTQHLGQREKTPPTHTHFCCCCSFTSILPLWVWWCSCLCVRLSHFLVKSAWNSCIAFLFKDVSGCFGCGLCFTTPYGDGLYSWIRFVLVTGFMSASCQFCSWLLQYLTLSHFTATCHAGVLGDTLQKSCVPSMEALSAQFAQGQRDHICKTGAWRNAVVINRPRSSASLKHSRLKCVPIASPACFIFYPLFANRGYNFLKPGRVSHLQEVDDHGLCLPDICDSWVLSNLVI